MKFHIHMHLLSCGKWDELFKNQKKQDEISIKLDET